MAELRALEDEIATWAPRPILGPRPPLPSDQERMDKVLGILILARTYSEALSFTSSTRQLARIKARLNQGTDPSTGRGHIPLTELSTMVAELRTRLGEDLQDRVFFCIADPARIQKFFKPCPDKAFEGHLIFKELNEVFDPEALRRFPEATDDIADACDCYLHDCATASVFHLMRIVEVGILRL